MWSEVLLAQDPYPVLWLEPQSPPAKGCDILIVLTGACESASATRLDFPFTCRMSVVNCEIKSRCRTCRGVYLSEWVESAKVNYDQ